MARDLITRDDFPLLLDPAYRSLMKKQYWDKTDETIPDMRSAYYDVSKTSDAFWATMGMVGLGNAYRKPEGTLGRTDKPQMGRPFTMVFPTWSLNAVVTEEMIEDDDSTLGPFLTKQLRLAMNESMEEDAVAQYNDGFTAQGWESDGEALFSTGHPILRPGFNGATTFSNKSSTDASLTEAALDSAYTTLRTQQNDSGRWLNYSKPVYLECAPALFPTATRLLDTKQKLGGNNNDVNLYYKMLIPRMNPRLTNPYSWFLSSDDNDWKWMNRVSPTFKTYWEESIGALVFKIRARWGRGATSPRGKYGSNALS